MGIENDALRALRAPISDRIDLRHRILDALVDRGGQLRALPMLGQQVDRIDGLIWRGGDMRQTRLRYEIFNTCLRKGVNLAEEIPSDDGKSADRHADLLEGVAALLNAHGACVGDATLDDLAGEDVAVIADAKSQVAAAEVAEFIQGQTAINQRLVELLQKMSNPPMIISEAHGEQLAAGAKMPPGAAVPIDRKTGMPLTENAEDVKPKKPPLPGTPGGKGKGKS